MAVYLKTFTLPSEEEEYEIICEQKFRNTGDRVWGYIDHSYPCGLFKAMDLSTLVFEPVTIFCGGNGTGKSTLLNLIAQKLDLDRVAPFNTSEVFGLYSDACRYTLADDGEQSIRKVPSGSRIITSDDIFDYMLAMRTNNDEVTEATEEGRTKWAELRFGETIKMQSLDDFEAVRMQVMARSKTKSRRKFLRETAGTEQDLYSNGETAIRFYEEKLKNDKLYCLDEPENSLSPKRQLELRDLLIRLSRYCGCQFIMATHSPFLLSLEGAKIYDLDSTPATVKPWWELESVKVYYEFFKNNAKRFK